MNRYLSAFLILVLFLASCASEKGFRPDRRYSPAQLQRDYQIFRGTLEAWHPSLYWYTSKDSMDRFFDLGYASLTDSMTEPQFRKVLSYVIAQVDCGHTSIKYSKAYSHYLDTAKLRQFPLIIKFWPDTMCVAANLNRRDTVLRRGTLIQSINGRPVKEIIDSLFPYIVTDGYNRTGKYQYLSTGFHFSAWYNEIYGFTDSFSVGYQDPSGVSSVVRIPVYDPVADTIRRSLGRILMPGTGQRGPGPARKVRPPTRRARKNRELFLTRNLQLDSASSTAFLTLNTFEHGYHLRGFFRNSFQTIADKGIRNLVIDVRSNGGGDASLSTLLTRYMIDKKFKLADSLYAIRRYSKYDRYINNGYIYDFLTFFASLRKSDGKYHFGYFERHRYGPLQHNHFDGQVYILTGGNSFSATCLFAGALKGQSNVTIVGEETGGAYYGNTAWMIPDVTLPESGVRFRLPRFRLVVDQARVKDGKGIQPDVSSKPSVEAIGRGLDFKTARAKELIRMKSAITPRPLQ